VEPLSEGKALLSTPGFEGAAIPLLHPEVHVDHLVERVRHQVILL
jgi:hypothetical protein